MSNRPNSRRVDDVPGPKVQRVREAMRDRFTKKRGSRTARPADKASSRAEEAVRDLEDDEDRGSMGAGG